MQLLQICSNIQDIRRGESLDGGSLDSPAGKRDSVGTSTYVGDEHIRRYVPGIYGVESTCINTGIRIKSQREKMKPNWLIRLQLARAVVLAGRKPDERTDGQTYRRTDDRRTDCMQNSGMMTSSTFLKFPPNSSGLSKTMPYCIMALDVSHKPPFHFGPLNLGMD